MKYITLILAFIINTAINAQKTDSEAFNVAFKDTIVHLGIVVKGEKASDTFTFTNLGNEAVQIDLVSSCECTTLDWSRGLIMPEEEGFIQFSFDSTTKTESEVIDIEIFFINTDEEGEPIFRLINYSYDLESP